MQNIYERWPNSNITCGKINKVKQSNLKNIGKVKESWLREETTSIQKEREKISNLNMRNDDLCEKLKIRKHLLNHNRDVTSNILGFES